MNQHPTPQLTPEARAAAERIRQAIDSELALLPRSSKIWRAAHGVLSLAERELGIKSIPQEMARNDSREGIA